MKLSAIEWCAIALTGLFLSFTIGYFVGSGNSGTISVEGSVAVITTSSGSEEESEDTDVTDEARSADSMLMEEDTAFSETDESSNASVTDENTPQGNNMEGAAASDGQSDSGLININTATEEELEALPGIGEELAARIVAYRSENGPYQTVEDITNVNGIGDGRLSAIRDYITVED